MDNGQNKIAFEVNAWNLHFLSQSESKPGLLMKFYFSGRLTLGCAAHGDTEIPGSEKWGDICTQDFLQDWKASKRNALFFLGQYSNVRCLQTCVWFVFVPILIFLQIFQQTETHIYQSIWGIRQHLQAFPERLQSIKNECMDLSETTLNSHVCKLVFNFCLCQDKMKQKWITDASIFNNKYSFVMVA